MQFRLVSIHTAPDPFLKGKSRMSELHGEQMSRLIVEASFYTEHAPGPIGCYFCTIKSERELLRKSCFLPGGSNAHRTT